MYCISCGHESEFERVVVGHQRPVVGALCVDCERRVLDAAGDVAGDDCALCARDGAYAVPVWDAMGVSEADDTLQFLEYDIDAATPRLCPDHYEELAADASLRVAVEE